MGSLRYLSYELDNDTPCFGANAPVQITVDVDFSTGPYIQHLIETINHNGSHVDVPSHFCPEGKTLSELPADTWEFRRVHLVDLPVPDDHLIGPQDLAGVLGDDAPSDMDALLVRTGFGACRAADHERYLRHNPGFGPAAADWLRERFPMLRGIFCDIPSYAAWAHIPEGVSFHQRMLGQAYDDRYVLLFEDILLPADLTSVAELWAVPIRLRDLDGAPVTILARS